MTKDPLLCHMEFVKDSNGKQMLIKDGTHQVMMEWEKPYMEACIEALCPIGHVLEIGFGCGYSATAIQKFSPLSHTIIEYHPTVAAKARTWAQEYKNVRIVEDTWQQALDKLGVFDQIFFDDYPLESQKQQKELVKTQEKASWIISKGKKVVQKIKDKFSFLESLQYKDEDLEYFFQEIKKKKNVSKEHFLPFFYELKTKGQITLAQYESILDRLLCEKIIDAQIKEDFLKKIQPKIGEFFSFNKRGDRFFDFLQRCLKKHMKHSSRFSCYLEHPVSRYDDEEFTTHVILNPHVDYQEKWVDVEVPSNCTYYKGDKALVMLITKKHGNY
jgi:hypothetical protein